MQIPYIILTMVLTAAAAFTLRVMISGRHVSPRVQKQGSSPFLGQYPMEFAYWLLAPIGKLATTFKVSPNFFSWLCLILGAFAGIFAGFGHIFIAGGLSIISALCDTLDGMVARSRGIASDAGEVLDAAIDRYTEFFFLAGLTIYYRFDTWAMSLTLTALLGSFMVSYSQAKAESLNVEIPKGWMRRPERATYLGGGAFLSQMLMDWISPFTGTTLNNVYHYPLLLAIALVAVFANASAAQRFVILYKKLHPKRD